MLLAKDIQVKYIKEDMMNQVILYFILDEPVAVKVIDMKMLKN